MVQASIWNSEGIVRKQYFSIGRLDLTSYFDYCRRDTGRRPILCPEDQIGRLDNVKYHIFSCTEAVAYQTVNRCRGRLDTSMGSLYTLA
jgi:hypothetical protein